MRARPLLRITAIILLALGLLLGLVAWSGIYSVAASRGHWTVTEAVLAFGMRRSVVLRTRDIVAPDLAVSDLIGLGAAHFQEGCAYCHGAPGVPAGPIAHRMLPPPPDLTRVVEKWTAAELFWIVKHGIKYTGMPAWVAETRDDEVWAVVAFLARLPALDRPAYLRLAFGDLPASALRGTRFPMPSETADALETCIRCHGGEGRLPASGLVPILHGQPIEMLTAALNAYARGWRQSGIMQPVAVDLAPERIAEVAAYYAGLAAPSAELRDVEPATRERGRRLAEQGDRGAEIPSCLSCHGTQAMRLYPRLAGQNAPYLVNRLRFWRDHDMAGTATDAIMAPIARRLSEAQAEDLAAYFASEPSPP